MCVGFVLSGDLCEHDQDPGPATSLKFMLEMQETEGWWRKGRRWDEGFCGRAQRVPTSGGAVARCKAKVRRLDDDERHNAWAARYAALRYGFDIPRIQDSGTDCCEPRTRYAEVDRGTLSYWRCGGLCHRYAVPRMSSRVLTRTVGWHPRLRLCQRYALKDQAARKAGAGCPRS